MGLCMKLYVICGILTLFLFLILLRILTKPSHTFSLITFAPNITLLLSKYFILGMGAFGFAALTWYLYRKNQ
jgi:hypothetical protein